MASPRNPTYDDPWFKEAWFSPTTIAEIAERAGVSIVSVYQAARRRGYPKKCIARREG